MTTSKFSVNFIRSDFPNLHIKVRGQPLTYLDNAATTLKPQVVIDTVNCHYSEGVSNIHRGVHYLSERATDAYEQSREKIRAFINAKSVKEIVFTRGTTESINLAAASYGRHFLKSGDEILISGMEHHSNIVPWQMLCEEKGCILKVIPLNQQGELEKGAFEKLLSDKTKIVSVVHISNSLGTINPIQNIIHKAHAKGAVVLVDAAQSISNDRINVQDLGCDFLAFSGHKLFGPTGTGVLYAKEALLEKMPPYQGGGDMISSVTFEKTTYNQLPYKFEAGTPHIAGVIGLGAAIDYLNALDRQGAKKHKEDLLAYGTQKLLEIPGLILIGTAAKKAPVLSFTLPHIHPHDLGTLVDQEGVAIRTGHHCTQPVMRFFKIAATARASLAFYNTREDIDRLVAAVINAQKVFK